MSFTPTVAFLRSSYFLVGMYLSFKPFDGPFLSSSRICSIFSLPSHCLIFTCELLVQLWKPPNTTASLLAVRATFPLLPIVFSLLQCILHHLGTPRRQRLPAESRYNHLLSHKNLPSSTSILSLLEGAGNPFPGCLIHGWWEFLPCLFDFSFYSATVCDWPSAHLVHLLSFVDGTFPPLTLGSCFGAFFLVALLGKHLGPRWCVCGLESQSFTTSTSRIF